MSRLRHIETRSKIIETCRKMNAAGINQGTSGNVSARVDDGWLLTPSGVPYDLMQPEQIVWLDMDGGYEGEWLPSSEWRMHYDILRAHPVAGAVVHCHSTYATALSSLRRDVPAFHYMIAVTGGTTLKCASYATFGTAELSTAMLAALKNRTACLLANHGQICFGANLDKALWLAIEVEALCKQYFIACQAGQPVILNKEQMDEVLARFQTYGKQPGDFKKGEVPAVAAPVRRDIRGAAGKKTSAAGKKSARR